jgi:hypothetical protein
MPTRRDFLKYLLATPIAASLDVEKMLWIPEKTIFVMPPRLHQIAYISDAQIIAIELERVIPKIREMFDRNDLFFDVVKMKLEKR